ncbi:MAG: polyribonucleotide nucleotidyltransferase [Microbacterium sp.]|nr:polyribonucleotide nucleotidyltransferase [Microbacterium sp.]
MRPDHGAGDNTVVLLDLLDVAPRTLVLRALLGQDEATFLVLLLENQGLDVIADVDDLVGVDVVLDRKLAGGDDTLGLVTDVEEDLVAVDLHDGALDEVAVVEELEGLLDRGQEVFGGADVVDRDLLDSRGGRCGSHVVGCPSGWVSGFGSCEAIPGGTAPGRASLAEGRTTTTSRSEADCFVRCHSLTPAVRDSQTSDTQA